MLGRAPRQYCPRPAIDVAGPPQCFSSAVKPPGTPLPPARKSLANPFELGYAATALRRLPMKRHLLLALLCLGLSLPALAQSDAPATREDIQRYLDAVHSQR